jgi:DNA-binding response OmpR family regulator
MPTPEHKPLLLLVEDNPDMRSMIVQIFCQEYNILEAEDGRQGEALALETVPDIVLSDVMMPDMDGYELCQRLKSQTQTCHIPFILLTAKSGQEHKNHGLEIGANDYVTKPFDPMELRLRMKNQLRQLEAMQQVARDGLPASLRTGAAAMHSRDRDFVGRLHAAIEAGLPDEGFSVEELSQRLFISRSQLYRKVLALTGENVQDLIRLRRLAKAHSLLLAGGQAVEEVAWACGFGSAAYFIKCFREKYGTTPGQLR